MKPRSTRRGGAWQEATDIPLGVMTCLWVTSVSWVLILISKPESLIKVVLLSSVGEEGAGGCAYCRSAGVLDGTGEAGHRDALEDVGDKDAREQGSPTSRI